jgi:hypothetical protein
MHAGSETPEPMSESSIGGDTHDQLIAVVKNFAPGPVAAREQIFCGNKLFFGGQINACKLLRIHSDGPDGLTLVCQHRNVDQNRSTQCYCQDIPRQRIHSSISAITNPGNEYHGKEVSDLFEEKTGSNRIPKIGPTPSRTSRNQTMLLLITEFRHETY